MKKEIWDNSKIDYISKILVKKRKPFIIKVLGSVKAHKDCADDKRMYYVRKMYYDRIVLIEQMIRVADPDLSDIFTSFAFKKGMEPKSWQLEVESKDVNNDDDDDDLPNYYGM